MHDCFETAFTKSYLYFFHPWTMDMKRASAHKASGPGHRRHSGRDMIESWNLKSVEDALHKKSGKFRAALLRKWPVANQTGQ